MSTIKTTIKISSHDKSERAGLWRLFCSIFDWVKAVHPDVEIDNDEVGRYYLRSIALHSEAITDIEDISTFGYLNRWTFSPANCELTIEQTTFEYHFAVAMWELIAKKYAPRATVTYKSICESAFNFTTNLNEYTGLYVVKTREKYNDHMSKQEVEAFLAQRYKGSFDDMLSSFRYHRPSNINIMKWDILPISETV